MVVNRFLVRARAQSTARSLHGSLSANWESQRAKTTGLTHRDEPGIFTGVTGFGVQVAVDAIGA